MKWCPIFEYDAIVREICHQQPSYFKIRRMMMEDSPSALGSTGLDLDLKEFLIPDYILNRELEPEKCALHVPEYPVIVFVNSKSGGQLGGHLLRTYRSLLNKYQVVDLLEEAPDKYLSKVYRNLETLKQKHDQLAFKIQQNLRLIVAGGDGTAGWLLGVVCDLKLPHPPAIATVPLGTGNNLPFAFGWGKRNPGTNEQAVKSFLYQVKMAKEMKIDNWHIVMRMRTPKEVNNCEPVAPLELPHALHSFQRVPSTVDSSRREDCQTFRGGFWNYFSMGMDAQVSYAFHAERKLHPEKFKNQLVNQSMYAKLICTQGWFLGSLLHPANKNIAQLAKVMIKKHEDGQWEELHIPRSIRSIICLNLPSFSGGLNPWGKPRKSGFRKREEFKPSYVDDGLIEVVGFRNAWQGLTLLSSKGHGTRLAQAHKICFKFHKGAAEHTYMRIDGEPWKQPLPVDDDTVEVEISPLGQVNMLAIHGCRSKSTGDPESVHNSGSTNGDDYDEDDEGSFSSQGDEWSKFGAADTFKIPDHIDISRFS